MMKRYLTYFLPLIEEWIICRQNGKTHMLGCLHSLLAASEKVSFLLFIGKPVWRHFSFAIPWCTSHLRRQHGWLEQVRESGVSLG